MMPRAMTYSPALINLKVAMFNKLYKQMHSAEKELRKRGKDARLKLLRIY